MNKMYISLLTILLALPTCYSLAHIEHDKSRFVALQGTNNSDCANVLRPCKSIAYAIKQANKGDKVLIARGQYAIKSVEELFYLKGLVVPILGGYNRFDHFQNQSPDTNPTVLTGIPLEMAADLRSRGFSIIADGKTYKNSSKLGEQLAAFNALNQVQTSQNCINGNAGFYECNNLNLLAHMPLSSFSTTPSTANDIWGHVDLNTGDEYAIIGLRNGIAVVNVTDPTNPKEVGTVAGANSVWRDIKVYQYYDNEFGLWRAYAYATIDSAPDNITIINLNNLPHSVSLVKKSNVVSTAHNIYITNVDHTFNIALSGLIPSMQLTGTNKNGGAFTNYSLTDPENITPVATLARGQGYTHDGASLVINDARKATACPNSDTCTIFADFNEKEFKLWNISDPKNVSLVSVGEYTDVASSDQYVHSGWPSEDKQYLFVHDEFDEKDAGINSTVRVFSIADIANPQHVGQWTGPTRAIDHNGFVRGNRYYLSNYERGFSVLDISDPINPTKIGFFDTYTPSNNAAYNGGWGAYPFLPSGNILVSDIGSGLYILQNKTLSSAQGSISFTVPKINVEQGNNITINVQRTNAQASATTSSVGYEILSGSATQNNDYIPVSGRLTWQNNDTTNKSITISIPNNNTGNELAEKFFVRLFDPKNGVTISSPSYIAVNIAGAVNTGVVNFVQSNAMVNENQQGAIIEVSRAGSSIGDISVNYSLISGSAEIGNDIENSFGTLNWDDGDSEHKVINLTLINDDIKESNESFFINLTSVNGSRVGSTSQLNVTISDDDTNTAPIVNLGENIQVNSGQTVNLTSSASDVENDSLTYLWSQTSGASVILIAADTATVSFVAPSLTTNLLFSLTVTDSKGLSTTDTINISVISPVVNTPPVNNKNGGGSSSYYLCLLLLLWLLKRSQQLKLN